jgi:hypothetical protein
VSNGGYRVLTIFAAAVLAFDGAALLGAGVWTSRPMLISIGVVLVVSCLLVLLSWRWYQRRLADIAAARRALGNEAREMQRTLHER